MRSIGGISCLRCVIFYRTGSLGSESIRWEEKGEKGEGVGLSRSFDGGFKGRERQGGSKQTRDNSHNLNHQYHQRNLSIRQCVCGNKVQYIQCTM